jgi:hypothetical protein
MDQMLAWGLFHWQLSRSGLSRPLSEDEFYARHARATRHGRSTGSGLWSRLRRSGEPDRFTPPC